MMRFLLSTLALLLLSASPASAASARSRIVRDKDEAKQDAVFLETVVEATAPEGLKEIKLPLQLYGPKGELLWQQDRPLVVQTGKPLVFLLKLEKIDQFDSLHRVEVYADIPELDLHYTETIRFQPKGGLVPGYGIRQHNNFPGGTVSAVLRLGQAQPRPGAKTTLSLSVLDATGTAILKRTNPAPFAPDKAVEHVFDATPNDLRCVGPFSLECQLESEDLELSWSDRFAYENSEVPVTGMETDEPVWYKAAVNLGIYGGVGGRLHDAQSSEPYRTYGVPYTPGDPPAYPSFALDPAVRHGGTRALRIDYVEGEPANVFGDLDLPGYPTMAKFWVKGNGSNDRLVIHWRDRCDYSQPATNRYFNRSSATICKLDFEDWRTFRVPVLGGGLQKTSRSGDLTAILLPISVMALSVEPGPVGKGQKPGEARSVWIDDLSVETQALPGEQLSLELRADNPSHRLREESVLHVALGSGLGRKAPNGRLSLVAKDRAGTVVLESNRDVEVPAEGWTVTDFPLGGILPKDPIGPIDVDVTFRLPDLGGSGLVKRIAFGCARSSGLVWDFEAKDWYNGWHGGDGAGIAPGGADGSGSALALGSNGVLLHPALPGLVDRIEFQVKGDGTPVELVPVLLDAGWTGVAEVPCNTFSLPPIRVDWTDWRKVLLEAPPVPAYYGNAQRFFLRRPWYPLNLTFKATGPEKKKSVVFIDEIRVTTHLLPKDELAAEVVFEDPTRTHKPGSPLVLSLTNFSGRDKQLQLKYRLESYQGTPAEDKALAIRIPAGGRTIQTLIPSVPAGIHTLLVDGLGELPLRETILALDGRTFLGDDPLAFLTDPAAMRKSLGMTVEKCYLDWDNAEFVPGAFQYSWFHNLAMRAADGGKYAVMPILGFSAEWAGPEARDSVFGGTYTRFIANNLQVPVRTIDWSRYVREMAREYKGRFERWGFWENPDLKDVPQYLPPARYPEMLGVAAQWLSLYDPKAKLVAYGFNMDTALDYLQQIDNPSKLPFQEIDIRMNLAELSPEAADVESYLDELDALLKLGETGRQASISELDWSVGEYISPALQAAYHTRAALIFASRKARPHTFSIMNTDASFAGYGVFYRTRYGNSENLQSARRHCIPKPAFFALMQTQRFLGQWTFLKNVDLCDSDLAANRVFLFQNPAGDLAAALWRVQPTPRTYRVPPGWMGVEARDSFGFPVPLEDGLRLHASPTFVHFPRGFTLDQLVQDLRTMPPADGRDVVLLDLRTAEPDSGRRADYSAVGASGNERHAGRIPGGHKVNESFVSGLKSERFSFSADRPGKVLLHRRWFAQGKGQKLLVRLNGGQELAWDLTAGDLPVEGVRDSTFVLRDCAAGRNTVEIAYAEPGNCSGYRLEALPGDSLPLADWGLLNAAQTKGALERSKNARGTPLAIGKTSYTNGLGSHANAFLELPLDGQFSRLEVTVGVDAASEGRGSVMFEIHVDNQLKAKSGLLTSFSPPMALKVEGLESARRLVLMVKDAGDGNENDVADWVDGKLFLK